MFEHMKNYQELMKRISTWLKEDGLLFVHILCNFRYAYPFVAKEGTDTEWMAKNFFSGGTMPSSDLLLHFQEHLHVKDIWLVSGTHYSKTLDAWLERMDERREVIMKIFKDDQCNRIPRKSSAEEQEKELNECWKKWRTFFLYCSETFNFNQGNDWMVAQYLFSKSSKSNL